MNKGRIFNIQRYSTHDGPGIRTTVFMKGCNLRCAWCHNPESIAREPAIEFNAELCVSCARCAERCPRGAHRLQDGVHAFDRALCAGCGLCAEECFAGALTRVGVDMSAERAMEEILTDRAYFEQSGGGVTFSGGECMTQIDFLTELCAACAERGVRVAVDTAGCVPWAHFERVRPYVSLYLYDVKAIDPDTHRRLTGADNALILQNLQTLLDAGERVWVRVPYVPDMNDGETAKIADWLAGKRVERVELLAYHRLGDGKRALLGAEDAPSFRVPTGEEMARALREYTARGVPAVLG